MSPSFPFGMLKTFQNEIGGGCTTLNRLKITECTLEMGEFYDKNISLKL